MQQISYNQNLILSFYNSNDKNSTWFTVFGDIRHNKYSQFFPCIWKALCNDTYEQPKM